MLLCCIQCMLWLRREKEVNQTWAFQLTYTPVCTHSIFQFTDALGHCRHEVTPTQNPSGNTTQTS